MTRNLGTWTTCALLGLLPAVGLGVWNASRSILAVPVPDAGRVFWVTPSGSDGPAGFNPDQLEALVNRDQAQITDVAAFIPPSVRGRPDVVVVGGRKHFVRTGQATPGMFRVFGTRASLGRLLTHGDTTFMYDFFRVCVISSHTWRTLFNGDPSVVGRQIAFTGPPYSHAVPLTVVGVLPDGAVLPADADLWVPLPFYNSARAPQSSARALVRLRPGVDGAAAVRGIQGALSGVAPVISSVAVSPLAPSLLGTSAGLLAAVSVACLALALIAIGDLIILGLVQGVRRRRSAALEIALGATALRYARRQVRAILLPAAGAAAVAAAAAEVISAVLKLSLGNRYAGVTAAARVGRSCPEAVAIALLGVLIWSLLPLAQMPWKSPGRSLANAEPRATQERRVRARLVWLTGALGAVTGASLFLGGSAVRHYYDSVRGIGMQVGGLLENVDVLEPESGRGYVRLGRELLRLQAAAEKMPGIAAIGMSAYSPGQPGPLQFPLRLPGRANSVSVNMNLISPLFFRAVGARILAGRGFSMREMADMVGNPQGQPVIVDDTAMRALGLTLTNAVGALVVSPPSPQTARIIGVVHRIKVGLSSEPQVYSPIPDSYVWDGAIEFHLYVRGRLSANALQPILNSSLQAAAAPDGIQVGPLRRAQDELPRYFGLLWFRALVGWAVLTLSGLSAMVGIYALVAWIIESELGGIAVRVVLGAAPGRALCPVLAGVGLAYCVSAMVGAWVLAELIAPAEVGTALLCAGALLAMLFFALLVSALRSLRMLRGPGLSGILRGEL